jgi:hypothetical protein
MLKLNFLFLVLIVKICAIYSQSQTCSVFEQNIDYNGNDLSFAYSSSPDYCCYLCSLNPQCNSFTFVAASQTCWLKSTVAANRISAVGSNF